MAQRCSLPAEMLAQKLQDLSQTVNVLEPHVMRKLAKAIESDLKLAKAPLHHHLHQCATLWP